MGSGGGPDHPRSCIGLVLNLARGSVFGHLPRKWNLGGLRACNVGRRLRGSFMAGPNRPVRPGVGSASCRTWPACGRTRSNPEQVGLRRNLARLRPYVGQTRPSSAKFGPQSTRCGLRTRANLATLLPSLANSRPCVDHNWAEFDQNQSFGLNWAMPMNSGPPLAVGRSGGRSGLARAGARGGRLGGRSSRARSYLDFPTSS